MIHWTDEGRARSFAHWLATVGPAHGLQPDTLRPASADASFRRYFRVDGAHGSVIVMDAPPEREDCEPFVRVARLLGDAGLHVPRVLEWARTEGFMLLTDLGETTYLQRLDGDNAAALYRDAIEALVRLQGIAAQAVVPAYDRPVLARELALFPQWYVQRHCGVALSEDERHRLEQVFGLLLDCHLGEPCVLVHRDYHSRNLMLAEPRPGILDFQDAVWGPISYDLVSLLRDAYIAWDEALQIDWAVRYWERARKAGLPVRADFAEFWRDFEWMGVQRQLKVLGIFARLWHRDGKAGYLADLPRVWRYAHATAMRYRELRPLALLLERLAGTQRTAGYTF